jgi:hypothetical protein
LYLLTNLFAISTRHMIPGAVKSNAKHTPTTHSGFRSKRDLTIIS